MNKLLKNIAKKALKLPLINNFLRSLDNQFERDHFIEVEIEKLNKGSSILDAGCGSQRYRKLCEHLDYFSQDFAQYESEGANSFGLKGVSGLSGVYEYGQIDFIGDIWEIDVDNESFDSVLCTEVFEHIPYPINTIKEFARILRSGGVLILTVPSNSLRHMDPYFFYTGFSNRWFEKILDDYGFENIEITPVGDYFSWMSVELFRTMRFKGWLAKLLCIPAFLYYYNVASSEESINALCMGYHVRATKKKSAN